MTEEPRQPTSSTSDDRAPAAKKSSGGCLAGCLGCGCLSILGFGLLAAVIGGYLWWQGPVLVDGITNSFEVVAGAGVGEDGGMDFSAFGGDGSDAGNSGGGLGLDTILGANSPQSTSSASASDASVTGDDALHAMMQFFDILDSPIGVQDINAVHSTLVSWGNTRTVRRFNGLVEDGQQLSDEESVMTQVRKLRLSVSMGLRIRDIVREYPEHIERHGGDDFQHQFTRIMAIHRLSRDATRGASEPWEQAVADDLLSDHDSNREYFEQARSALQDLMKREDFDITELSQEEQTELFETFGNLHTRLSGIIHRDSLEVWARLSDGERKTLIETINAPHNEISRTLGILGGGLSQEMVYLQYLNL